WTKSMQGNPMREACERARIVGASFHSLRHTYASLSVMAGMPLMVLAKNLGHRDTRMVEQHYGHLSRDHVRKAIQASAARFGFKPDPTVAPLRRGAVRGRGRMMTRERQVKAALQVLKPSSDRQRCGPATIRQPDR